MQTLCTDEIQTIEFAKEFAKTLQKNDIICLRGSLGAGKTVFAREIIRCLTQNPGQDVPSPTFTLLQTYETINFPLFHYDLYRIQDPDDVIELGWEDSLAEGLVIVEWPQRLGALLPRKHVDIHIQTADNNPDHRQITIKYHE